MRNIFQKLSPRGWELVIVLIPIVVGAIAIYIRTIGIEEQKALFEQRKYAYQEFFEGTANFWRADQLRYEESALRTKAESERDKDKAEEFRRKAKELSKEADELFTSYGLLWSKARLKIAVLSNADVVTALARYFERPEFEKRKCDGKYEKWTKDVAIYEAIRRETKPEGDVGRKDMALVLFDCILEK